MVQQTEFSNAFSWNNYIDEKWLSQRTEEILEPDLPIVDPHHHLWQWTDYMYRSF